MVIFHQRDRNPVARTSAGRRVRRAKQSSIARTTSPGSRQWIAAAAYLPTYPANMGPWTLVGDLPSE